MSAPPEWLIVGKILAAFGTRGEVRVLSQTDFPERFEPGARLFVEREPEPFRVEHSRWHKGQAVIKLAEVADRNRAEELRGRYLRVPGDDLAKLSSDQFYVFQIVGLNVVTEDGRELGPVAEVLETGANDVYAVRTERGELLLPAIEEVIRQVDLEGGRLVVHLLPGLLPDEAEEIQ